VVEPALVPALRPPEHVAGRKIELRAVDLAHDRRPLDPRRGKSGVRVQVVERVERSADPPDGDALLRVLEEVRVVLALRAADEPRMTRDNLVLTVLRGLSSCSLRPRARVSRQPRGKNCASEPVLKSSGVIERSPEKG
jgi:hypothetical protein